MNQKVEQPLKIQRLFDFSRYMNMVVLEIRLRNGCLITCPKCTELMHLNEELAFNETLQREHEEKADEAEVTQIRRERDRMRQRNSRLCRKFGLKSRRDRKRGCKGCKVLRLFTLCIRWE